MTPLVSIIIPSYNRAHLIGETLDSVINQTYSNWECIVVDDGSTDYTQELIDFYCEKDSRIKYHHRPVSKPKGANACRNYGFEISNGEFINWFDSDDLMEKDHLKMKVEVLLHKEESNFVVCESTFFHKSNGVKIFNGKNKIKFKNSINDFVLTKFYLLTPGPLWRKNFLTYNALMFDEKLSQSQDYDFHLKAIARSPKFEILKDSLLLIRKSNDSISSNFLYNNISFDEINSYLITRERGLNYILNEKDLVRQFYNMIISVMRRCMRNQDYFLSELCLNFLEKNKKLLSLKDQLRFSKVKGSYLAFKILGKGENFFKNFMKL